MRAGWHHCVMVRDISGYAQAPRTIDHQLAYSMFPIWLGAILLLLILLAWAQIPAASRD